MKLLALLPLTCALMGCSGDGHAQGTSVASGALEEELRALEAGQTFEHPELLDLTWAGGTVWSVVATSFAESASPMSDGKGGSGGPCRAYGLLLRGEMGMEPWAAIALFCEHGFVPTESKRPGPAATTWMLPARNDDHFDLRLRFVEARETGRTVLWATERTWNDGYLCAVEYAFERDGDRARRIMDVVGADPVPYELRAMAAGKATAKAALDTYDATFVGSVFPKPFRAKYRANDREAEVVYRPDGDGYRWAPNADAP